jgi:hypothetical protein
MALGIEVFSTMYHACVVSLDALLLQSFKSAVRDWDMA